MPPSGWKQRHYTPIHQKDQNDGLYEIQYCYPNNIILFVNTKKFEPNPILANINKFEPYRYLRKALKRLETTIEGGGAQGGLKVKGELEKQRGLTKMFFVWLF
jgi:hypothetical protein